MLCTSHLHTPLTKIDAIFLMCIVQRLIVCSKQFHTCLHIIHNNALWWHYYLIKLILYLSIKFCC